VTSQWNKEGHIYPTQVGQFGLSHYSKWQNELFNSNKNIAYRSFLIDHENKFILHYAERNDETVRILSHGFEFNLPGGLSFLF
jgi:hypothetical protein